MNALSYGAALVLPAPHFSPEDSLKAVVKEKCDVIYGTPTSETYFGDIHKIRFSNTGKKLRFVLTTYKTCFVNDPLNKIALSF